MRENIVVEGNLLQFAKEYCNNYSSLELLLFFGRHPHAWFSQQAIIRALDARKAEIFEAIQYLMDKGLVVTRTNESGLRFFSLAKDSPSRDSVLELVALDFQHIEWLTSLTYKCISLKV